MIYKYSLILSAPYPIINNNNNNNNNNFEKIFCTSPASK